MTRAEAETYVRVLNKADSEYMYVYDPYQELLCQSSRSNIMDGTQYLDSPAALLRLRTLSAEHNRLSDQCMTVIKQYT